MKIYVYIYIYIYIPLAPSVDYFMHLTKLLILKYEWSIEWVDHRSLSWVVSHKPTESRTQEPQGYL